jgi:2-polyprenyl-3-methyl-5-hydroxy-6-metoxy-1,4-benzoquinol methylase
MADIILTARQVRERQYYQEYSKLVASTEVCFDPVTSTDRRPWNSYWFVMDLALKQFQSPNQKLLDFGCGAGEFSLLYGKIGYEVSGVDLCPENISIAKARARRYDMEDRVQFSTGLAERLDYPDETFDVIVGVDILHHVDVNKAIAECQRVLKKGGVAIFHEPIRVPIFDALRDSQIGLWIAPKTLSYDQHLTEDERKLTTQEIKSVSFIDANPLVQRFRLTTRVCRLLKFLMERTAFEKLDQQVFRFLPFLKNYGGIIVLALRK